MQINLNIIIKKVIIQSSLYKIYKWFFWGMIVLSFITSLTLKTRWIREPTFLYQYCVCRICIKSFIYLLLLKITILFFKLWIWKVSLWNWELQLWLNRDIFLENKTQVSLFSCWWGILTLYIRERASFRKLWWSNTGTTSYTTGRK